MRKIGYGLALLGAICGSAAVAKAQDNYEIQVYEYDQVEPGHTMVELHSNFMIDGSKTVQNGVLPTNHAEHFTFSPLSATDLACNGSAITSAHVCAFHRNGNGRWA